MEKRWRRESKAKYSTAWRELLTYVERRVDDAERVYFTRIGSLETLRRMAKRGDPCPLDTSAWLAWLAKDSQRDGTRP